MIQVEELLHELKSLRTSMAIVRNAVQTREDDVIGLLCGRISDALVQLSREKIVTGVLTGGMLTLDDLPDGVSVDIRNYDAHGTEENLETDDSGCSYSNLHWGAW